MIRIDCEVRHAVDGSGEANVDTGVDAVDHCMSLPQWLQPIRANRRGRRFPLEKRTPTEEKAFADQGHRE
jgi:hypothetical protein